MQDNKEKYLVALQESRVQLQQQALYDELTGLPNRRLFAERLGQSLAMADREGYAVALLYLDLDGFKPVNDNLGHAVGDLVLKAVANRMSARIRKSDTVSRMGGDEFTLILPHVMNREDAARVGRDLLRALADRFFIDGHTISLTASIGVSVYPDEASSAGALIHQADSAMYVVKHAGKNDLRFFTTMMETPGEAALPVILPVA
jgi:diguanylate cyclase (GGDEF)-like protein